MIKIEPFLALSRGSNSSYKGDFKNTLKKTVIFEITCHL
jgi:hypothetical protein